MSSLIVAHDYGQHASHATRSIINRYYDPSTDQFLSIDPDVQQTDQPYVFTNDNPLNAEDPTGQNLVKAIAKVVAKVVKVVVVINDVSDGNPGAAAKALDKTVAVCLSASASFGAGATGSACAGFTGNGKGFASVTGGVGGGSPNASIGVGVMFSNANTATQLGRNFSYAVGSAGDVITIGGEGSIGSSGSKTIVVGNASLNLGGPWPLSYQAGESWTIIWK